MPNLDELFTTDKLRALLANEAITPTERVYRALVALCDRLDDVHIEALESKKMVGALAGVVKERIAGSAKLPVPPSDDSAEVAVATPSAPTNKVKDSTPFPAGVSATVGGAPVTAPAVAEPVVDSEDLTPNVASGPATNAQPIPGSRANGPAPSLNQSKVTKVTKNANA